MGQTFLDSKVKVVADYRERAIIRHLRNYDCSVKESNLKVGDFIASDRVGIERKTYQDFVNSIFDGRLFRQASELRNNFQNPVIIIEGRRYFGKVNRNSIRGAMSSVIIDFGIPLVFTDDEDDTAGMIFTIAKREQEDLKRTVSIRGRKKSKTIYDAQKFLVAGLPFVNSKMSVTLLKKFKTPERVFTASEEELKKVPGIGEKKAKAIKKLLQTVYSDENE